MQDEHSSFIGLPPELKLRVAGFLDRHTALAVALTQSSWTDIAEGELIRSIDLPLYPVRQRDNALRFLERMARTPQKAARVSEFSVSFSDPNSNSPPSASVSDWDVYIRALRQMRGIKVLHLPDVRPITLWNDILALLEDRVLCPSFIILGQDAGSLRPLNLDVFRSAVRAQANNLRAVGVYAHVYGRDEPEYSIIESACSGFASVFGYQRSEFLGFHLLDQGERWSAYFGRIRTAVQSASPTVRRMEITSVMLCMYLQDFAKPATAAFAQLVAAAFPVSDVMFFFYDATAANAPRVTDVPILSESSALFVAAVRPFALHLESVRFESEQTHVLEVLKPTAPVAHDIFDRVKEECLLLRSITFPNGRTHGRLRASV